MKKSLIILTIFISMVSCRREDAGANIASNSCNMPDTYMQVKNSAPSGEVTFFTDKNLQNPLGTVGSGIPVVRQLTSETDSASLSLTSSNEGLALTDDTAMQIKQSLGTSGAWITTDLNRSNNLGYVAGGTPVIRQLTQNTSSGAKVARIDIRGGSLANKVGWASYSDLEPRGGGSADSASSAPTSSGANSSKLKVMRADVRGGSLANKVGWTLADNLEPRACQAQAKVQQCTGNTISACDSTGCKCVDTGTAPESVVGNMLIDTLSTLGAGLIKDAFIQLAKAAIVRSVVVNDGAMMAAAEMDVAVSNLNLVQIAQQVNPLRLEQYKHLSAGLRGLGGDCENNCISCALTVESFLRGNPAVALPAKATNSIPIFQEIFGGSWLKVPNYYAFINALAKQSGRRFIAVFRSGNSGHVLNVVEQNGKVWFVDGQIGKVFSADEFVKIAELNKWSDFYILPTQKL